MGAVKITARTYGWEARQTNDLGNNCEFCSADLPSQWICFDFKALRIEPTHYTIQTYCADANRSHLRSWAIEGSDDGASWTEIDRRENNNDLNGELAVKTFVVAPSASFRRIALRQIGLNHKGGNELILSAFELRCGYWAVVNRRGGCTQ
jgi:hypothetical protein